MATLGGNLIMIPMRDNAGQTKTETEGIIRKYVSHLRVQSREFGNTWA